MSDKYDGGSAFPIETTSTPYAPGMSLRDWFAGQAPDMPNWWMSVGCPTPPPGWKEGDGPTLWDELRTKWNINRIALWRFAYADAMLEARK